MKDDGEREFGRRLHLELTALSPIAQVIWLVYCAYLLEKASSGHLLDVFVSNLHEDVQSFLNSGFLSDKLRTSLSLSTTKRERNLSEDFAFLCSSQILSRKLLARFGTIYLAPSDLPAHIDSAVYWQDVAEQRYLSLVREALELSGWSSSVQEFTRMRREFSPSYRKVGLVTSIFNGDRFLHGFLENVSRLVGYEQCEHFLVRANSPGNEHDVLAEFVRRNEAAIYLNLSNDPGLYEVWNLAASLATAPILSNANVDDRRHPEHVVQLSRILREERDVDVASTPVRVSAGESPSWEHSKGLRTFFAGPECPRGSYTFDRLVRLLPNGTYAPNNIPHCMPLWRRELHVRFGFFHEREFGPSSDWEFWLRCGIGGARFYLHPKPLGLYFRSAGSYWRRNSNGERFNRRILDVYLGYCLEENASTCGLPFGRSLTCAELDRMEKAGAWFDLFARLACFALRGAPVNESARKLIDHYAVRHFGIEKFCATISVPAVHRGNGAPTAKQIFECALYCLAESKHVLSETRIARTWLWLCMDYYELCGCDDGLVAMAYIYHVRGERTEAWRLLRQAWMRSSQFWPTFQTLFRFELGLKEILRNLEADKGSSAEWAGRKGSHGGNVWFYPAYQDNPYQTLLYQPLIDLGRKAVGLRGLSLFRSIPSQREGDNALHLHWIHDVFKRATTSRDMERMTSKFLKKVRRLRSNGVRVIWLVHNYLSHEARWPEEEWRFRHSLANEVDEVIVHHPLVTELLDWLPDSVRPRVVEHGSYRPTECWADKRRLAREKLSLSSEDQVIVCSGQIRAYKQLESYLPHLLEWVRLNRAARLFVLGRIHVPVVRQLLAQAPVGRVLVRDDYIPEDELDDYLHAADWGFLSYRAILTSGSLFYMLSRGLPAIAPNKGTIPAYVINGWNGYLYDSEESLRSLLRTIGELDTRVANRMHDNALSLAKTLDWSQEW